MNVLVTGGAGFVGSHLVDGLVQAGHWVRVLDDFSTGRYENLATVPPEVGVWQASILDAEVVGRAMDGIEVVFHQAAVPSVPRSIRDPITSNEVNVRGTLNVLLAASAAGVRRLVYAASSSAYGATPGEARVETMPTQPMSPYAVAKLTGEQYCRVFTHVYGLETVCLRYFNVFGPRQDPNGEYAAVIPRFITALLEGRPLTLYGDGTQSRDFTYVGTAVAANLRAMTAPGVSGELFNVGCGHATTLNELARMLGWIADREPEIRYLPPRPGDVPHSMADCAKARSLLGYEPATSLIDGLRMTWQFFADQHGVRAAAPSRESVMIGMRGAA